MSRSCVKCYEFEAAIKKHKLICGLVSYEGELLQELGRHRYTPYPKKELEAQKRADEDAGKSFFSKNKKV